MATAGKRKLIDYIEAFAHFGGHHKVFHTRPFGRHALINDSINVYQVSHFEDLIADYQTYFKPDYLQTYTQFPADLWTTFLNEKIQLSTDDLIIDLYQSWKIYWKGQEKNEAAQITSFNNFNTLVENLQINTKTLIESATQLDEQTLLPIIALTIKKQYSKPKDFYADCFRLMTQQYEDQIGDGEVFVKVGPDGYPESQTFFIYSVDEKF
jgi:hypothetical protein